MRFILIGNYLPDGQESMQRFAQMLAKGLHEAGHEAIIWRPRILFARWSNSTTAGLGKWLGYVDKWIVFPWLLRWRLVTGQTRKAAQPVHFHICDHSNAAYLRPLPATRTAITCHDVLAIRGALGYADAHNPASGLGKLMQRWILGNLRRAKRLAAVSHFTLSQLRDLSPAMSSDQNWCVIHNAFNADFAPLPSECQHQLLNAVGLPIGVPFLLHVGSGLPRKNRSLLLHMAYTLGADWPGFICFAGEKLEASLKVEAETLGLAERVVSIVKPDHLTLVALYSACTCFVFPSYSEGFGWPVIEAQACGAPVIASDIEPMPEVSGGAALYASPHQPAAWATALRTLQNSAARAQVVEAGYLNSEKFAPARMIDAYIALHCSTAN
jgi:glycosyltransferase involved in cell wall biosynthesis